MVLNIGTQILVDGCLVPTLEKEMPTNISARIADDIFCIGPLPSGTKAHERTKAW